MNANVVIAPDDDLFDQPRWPAEIRQDRDAGMLEQYFDTVRQMLQIEAYGNDLHALPKLEAHRKSTHARGAKYTKVDVAVNFAAMLTDRTTSVCTSSSVPCVEIASPAAMCGRKIPCI